MKFVVGNWKMNVGVRESVALARGTLLTLRGRKVGPDVILCPSFVALSEVRKVIARSSVKLGAQNLSHMEKGSMTGEISGRMLEELAVQYVIVGHSERRHVLAEDNAFIAQKMQQALSVGLTPILCVGETAQERDAGSARDVVREQLVSAFSSVHVKSSAQVIVAYEPVWAIGSGKTAEVADVVEMHTYMRSLLNELLSGQKVVVLYGGSISPENAYQFLREAEIDGVLVGGASVKLNQFKEIVGAASEVLEAQTT